MRNFKLKILNFRKLIRLKQTIPNSKIKPFFFGHKYYNYNYYFFKHKKEYRSYTVITVISMFLNF